MDPHRIPGTPHWALNEPPIFRFPNETTIRPPKNHYQTCILTYEHEPPTVPPKGHLDVSIETQYTHPLAVWYTLMHSFLFSCPTWNKMRLEYSGKDDIDIVFMYSQCGEDWKQVPSPQFCPFKFYSSNTRSVGPICFPNLRLRMLERSHLSTKSLYVAQTR